MDLKTREYLVLSKRRELAGDDLNYEVHDALVCQLLSYSAALMEAGRLQDGHAAIMDADEEVEKLAASPFWRDVGVPGRIIVLSAACRYNMSVLFFEADDPGQGSSFLAMAIDKLAHVAVKDREREIYTTFKSTLDELVRIVRLRGG